jgi:hypothetical protein
MGASIAVQGLPPGLLAKERIVAGPGFNRWLVPPAALAIHLCIGMAYGFSVFWLPRSKALGIKEARKCGPEVGFFGQLFTTQCDWSIATLGWIYTLFFVLGGVLYFSIPANAGAANKLMFVGAFCIILSMYGGAFATVPAYLADLFGTQMVGAIHGRLLTAWATAGIIGPVVVNYMREYQLGLGIPREQVYNQTMFILVGMLMVGLICNWMVRPVADKHFMTEAELAEEKRLAHDRAVAADVGNSSGAGGQTPISLVWMAWAAVGLPLAWGVYRTALSVGQFFH